MKKAPAKKRASKKKTKSRSAINSRKPPKRPLSGAPLSTKTTAKKKELFLAAFAKSGNVWWSTTKAGVERTTHYRWLKTDKAYVKKFEQAREDAGDLLEAEILRRGYEGVLEPVFYRGVKCGEVRKYSDTLLIFHTKGVRPEKYRENLGVQFGQKTDDGQREGNQLEITVIDKRTSPDENGTNGLKG